jgi:hypothetical protein
MQAMTKLKAFATHLSLSFVIFLFILFLIVFEWYPPPFFTSDGGWQGIRIIAGVDLVLGPVLTLIVIKPGKPGLKFDLVVIALVQTTALAWGIWTVHHERPIATVFVENYFAPVTLYEIQGSGMSATKLQTFGSKPPYWIFSKLPSDPDALQKVRLEALRMGRPLFMFAEYYHVMDKTALQVIKAHALDMPKWLQNKPLDKQRYQQFLNRHNDIKDLIFIPWHARQTYEIIALDADTGKYIGATHIPAPKVTAAIPTINSANK